MVHMKDGKIYCKCGNDLGSVEKGQWFCDQCQNLYYKPDKPTNLMKWIKKGQEELKAKK